MSGLVEVHLVPGSQLGGVLRDGPDQTEKSFPDGADLLAGQGGQVRGAQGCEAGDVTLFEGTRAGEAVGCGKVAGDEPAEVRGR